MNLHSAATVFVLGGSGTNWEIFQILEMLKFGHLTGIPVYILEGSASEGSELLSCC